MKSIYALFLIVIFPFSQTFSQAFSQEGYLLTERVTQEFSDGELTSGTSTTYMYDEQERLIRSETPDTYSNYIYEGNNVTIEGFSFSDNEIISRIVEIRNQDGFRLAYSNYALNGDELELMSLDSFTRNSDNQVIQNLGYRDIGNGLRKFLEENTEYTSDGNIFSAERIFFSDEGILSIISTSNVYNSENLIERAVIKTEYLSNNSLFSDTISYAYSDDEMISWEFKDYAFSGFSNCTLTEFEMEDNLGTTIVKKSFNPDCSDLKLFRKTETVLNKEELFGLESSFSFEYNDDKTMEMVSSLIYVQEGNYGDNEISVNIITVLFYNEQEYYKSIKDNKYKKSQLVSNNNLFLEKEMLVFPNRTSQRGLVNYKAEGVEYDNIKIVDITGQTISYEPIGNKQNQYFVAPSVGGMYFVQLFNGQIPVTKAAKLIVK